MKHALSMTSLAMTSLLIMSPSTAEQMNGEPQSSGAALYGQNSDMPDRGVSKMVERPTTSGSGTVKTATSGAPGVNNLPTAEDMPQSSGSGEPSPYLMPSGTSGGPGVQGAPHVGVPGTGRMNEGDKVNSWGEKIIEK